MPLLPSGAPPRVADGAAMSYQPVITLKLLRVPINSSNTETSVTKPPVRLQKCCVMLEAQKFGTTGEIRLSLSGFTNLPDLSFT